MEGANTAGCSRVCVQGPTCLCVRAHSHIQTCLDALPSSLVLMHVLHTYPTLGPSLLYLLLCFGEPLHVSEGKKLPEHTLFMYSSIHSPMAPSSIRSSGMSQE